MAEDDIGRLKNRFFELSERAERTCTWQETRFLTMAEQSVLLSMRLPAALFGGYEGAERRIAYFGSEEQTGYPYEPPISCIRIAPVNSRFADDLTHRDFLGALMALGIVREMLGDILIKDNCGYLFCLESIAPHIIENLTEVKRTCVRCELGEPPRDADMGGEVKSFVVPSERLDALICAVWKLPRGEAKALCERGLVYVDSRLCEKAGAALNENAVVSVRGRGRFRFLGLERETKKGRLRVNVEVYSR